MTPTDTPTAPLLYVGAHVVLVEPLPAQQHLVAGGRRCNMPKGLPPRLLGQTARVVATMPTSPDVLVQWDDGRGRHWVLQHQLALLPPEPHEAP